MAVGPVEIIALVVFIALVVGLIFLVRKIFKR